MESRKFDTLSKALASDTPRRNLLRGMIVGAFAALGIGQTGAAQSGGNGNGNGNGNLGSGNGNGNGNGNSGWWNGNWNGNGNSGDNNGNDNGNWNSGNRNGNGNGNSNGWCPPWLSCPGSGYIDDATCSCICPLTTADCPGGVDAESCSCIPVVCDALADPCGPNCSCATFYGSNQLVCVDHGGACGYQCGAGQEYENNCPSGMICADAGDCGDYFCYPMCGDTASCAMVPDILV